MSLHDNTGAVNTITPVALPSMTNNTLYEEMSVKLIKEYNIGRI